ncbi:MAG: DUF2779 domain-containing protein [Endomicrobium sp.]|jgi:radical SAM protein with 4Fe4S-binding SPASM domain|nr:DUF2779 domain-containing protein [Endomicrobium sp.]
MTKYINKIVFINYLRCPTLGWMTKMNMIHKENSISNKFFNFEIKIIRKISQNFFLRGANRQKSNIDVICDASFIVDNCYAKIDILKKSIDNGFDLLEVKSSIKHKIKHIDDLSFNAMVLRKFGINIRKCIIVYLSNKYRLGMNVSSFFRVLDCTSKVESRSFEFLNILNEISEALKFKSMPKPYLKKECKNCFMFSNCVGENKKNHIFNLPNLSNILISDLINLGIDTIHDIPSDFKLTKFQKIIKNCVLSDMNYVSKNLKICINSIKEPFYYLDFESLSTAIPLYMNIGPNEQIITQFSIYKTDINGNILHHYEYIADHKKYCMRNIVEKFIMHLLDTDGSIMTYSSFERNIILKLIYIFPDLFEKLNKIIARIVDLELIIKENYYDVNFHGRLSIKKIISVIAPKLNYLHLKIKNGRDAMATFAFMAIGLYDNEKIKQIKSDLLKYCAMDTLAMIHIHQFLINICNE